MLVEKCSEQLQLPVSYLLTLGRSANYQYKTYTIPKRGGGQRTIHHPSKKLKAVQRWLLSNVFPQWPVHPAAHAYETGKGIRSNAGEHLGAKYLLRMDLTEFFPSLRSDDIRQFWSDNPELVKDWTEPDLEWFRDIVCYQGALTIGAPTSPKLSNVLCWELDTRLSGAAQEKEVIYSRYADDMFFSTTEKGLLLEFEAEVVAVVEGIQCPANLAINEDKTHHASARGRLSVTGLRLTQEGELSVGRQLKRFIRSQVYKYEQLDAEERRKLAGFIAYIRSVEPDFVNRLILKYGAEVVERASTFP